jgi:hypothetical protein
MLISTKEYYAKPFQKERNTVKLGFNELGYKRTYV